jgi:C4-dicarboxylate-specific signal transduction histidine kinase
VLEEQRRVLVADSGPGISAKMVPHVFEPFFSEKSPPSGLGLYICRFYLGQCGASIRLAADSERTTLTGAHFLLDFSRSPNGEVRR